MEEEAFHKASPTFKGQPTPTASSRAVEQFLFLSCQPYPTRLPGRWRRLRFRGKKGEQEKKVRKKTSKNQARKNVHEEWTIGVNVQCKIINTDGVDQIARENVCIKRDKSKSERGPLGSCVTAPFSRKKKKEQCTGRRAEDRRKKPRTRLPPPFLPFSGVGFSSPAPPRLHLRLVKGCPPS